jgi:hypothetical protein
MSLIANKDKIVIARKQINHMMDYGFSIHNYQWFWCFVTCPTKSFPESRHWDNYLQVLSHFTDKASANPAGISLLATAKTMCQRSSPNDKARLGP